MKGRVLMIPTPIQKAKTHVKNLSGHQSPNLLGKHPLIIVMIIILCSLIFGVIAYYVQQKGSLVQWDMAMVNRMHETALNSATWMKNIMVAGFYIGYQGYIVIGILLSLYFIFKKFWKEFFMVMVLYAGQVLLFYSLTQYFARPRPIFTIQIGAVIKYSSFPSGHMLSIVICVGLITYFFAPKISSRFWKASLIILAVLMVLFIGYSRFFMGAHYLTDIAAGLAVGVAWTCIAIMLIELLFNKGGYKHDKEK